MWPHHVPRSLCPLRPVRGMVMLSLALLMMTLASCGDATPFGGTVPHTIPLTTSRPFVVLLCKAADVPTVPHDLAYYQKLFTDKTPSLRNVYNYFVDQSYGAIDIAGTVIKDWLPTKYVVLPSFWPFSDRTALAQDCADAFRSSVHFPDFKTGGIVTIWNVEGADGGATGITEDGIKYPAVNAGAGAMWYENSVSYFTHEMLHDLGLNHAHGPAHTDSSSPPLKDQIDLGDDHVFGSLKWNDYGDCWSIMGCGYWVTPDPPFYSSDSGPDLGAVQKDVLGWVPRSRIVVYDRTGTVTVRLAPANDPSVAGYLLIKIPIGDAGYYTVEFAQNSGWSAAAPIKQAVLIHEQRSGDLSSPFLIGRTIYGAWFPGQVFRDTANHLRVSIDSFGDVATVTLSSDGPGDGGAFTCIPGGYVERAGDPDYSPTIAIMAPLALPDGSFMTGTPITLTAKANDPVLAPAPVPDDHILWQLNGTSAGTGRVLTHTFSKPGDYTFTAHVLGRSCYSVSTSVIIHAVPASSPPLATPTTPIGGPAATPTPTSPPASAKLSVSPTQTTGYCFNGLYPSLSVSNTGTATLQWSASGPQGVSITPQSGTLAPNQQPQTVTLSGFYPGHATLVISFASNGGNQDVTITCQ